MFYAVSRLAVFRIILFFLFTVFYILYRTSFSVYKYADNNNDCFHKSTTVVFCLVLYAVQYTEQKSTVYQTSATITETHTKQFGFLMIRLVGFSLTPSTGG